MKHITEILILLIVLNLVYSCSSDSIVYNQTQIIYDTIKVYDTIKSKPQNFKHCIHVSPVKTFGLYVNIEIPMEVDVKGVDDSLINVTTDNGIITYHGNFYKIKTEKIGSTIITVSHNGNEIAKRYFSALQLPKPTPQLGNLRGNEIAKKDLLGISILRAKMPYYCDLYGASIKSFCMVAYQNGIEKKLKSESNRFTEEQVDLINELKSGHNIYFENIIAKTQDGFTHELEILKIQIK